ncbi:MAG: aldo/keto reductase, partial [Deltaproteobacteria bacterium]|nr:aldo/keto reductase [Deltaproteobacteria bacterium]
METASNAPWGLGTLRLHEADDPTALVQGALDRGCRLLDLADVYGDGTTGQSELLAAQALAGWAGPRDHVRVVTKGGLVRRAKGRWDTNGKAKHLTAACEGSLERLGRIDLYLLHAPDHRTALSTSVRALKKLLTQGIVGAVGLCNVRVCDIVAARRIVEVSAVQVAMSPFDREPVDGGVARYCAEHGIELLAHSPFGGFRNAARIGRSEVLAEVAARHGVSGWDVATSWLASLGALPLVGSRRVETLPTPPTLSPDDLGALDATFPAGTLRRPRPPAPPADAGGEVVLLMGQPGAGKSSAVAGYLERGYERLNRDERGGRLDDLLPVLAERLAEGRRRQVLDNTYASRAARQRVVDVAWAHGVPTRCAWLQTPNGEAMRNVAERMLDRHGRLLTPADMSASRHPADFAPSAQTGWHRRLEPPTADEGHAVVEDLLFVRRERTGDRPALAFDCRLLWGGKPVPGEEASLAAGVAEALVRWAASHTLVPLAFLAQKDWPPAEAQALLARTCELVAEAGVSLPEVLLCDHAGAGPAVCWCRKPMPGLVVQA